MMCKGCGMTMAELDPPGPDVEHCSDCPPWLCDQCGQMDSMQQHCPCWQSLDGMNLAELKAVFAADGLSVDLPAATPEDTNG